MSRAGVRLLARVALAPTLALVLAGAPGLAGAAHAQAGAAGDSTGGAVSAVSSAPPRATDLVRFSAPAAVTLKAGGATTVRLTFRVPEPWHVNAHHPNDDFLIPTVLRVEGANGVTPGEPTYPRAVQARLAFSESPLAVYEGEFTIALPLSAAPGAAPGARTLKGTLRFQSCNDQVCLPPAQIALAIPLVVQPGEAAPAPPTQAAQPESVTAAGPATGDAGAGGAAGAGAAVGGGAAAGGSANLVSRWFEERGSLLAFLLIFLMGLALNLTPCVYPMMGVTISLFGGGVAAGAGGGAGGLKALPRALVYVLGIALMYSTLGVVAALTGGLFGGWLSNPWVLGAIGLLLFAMALSMFGLYELQAPSALLSKLGGAAGAGMLGTFLAGLMVGVFAAPCIGPPIIALLAHVGAKGDPVFGFWAFFVLSLGLGLPYLVLGVSSGLLQRLPRSGSWMDWVKHLFGVVLLGVAAFYLCLALAPSKLGWVVPGALALGGLYLGFFEPTGRDRPGFRRFKWAVGVAGIAAAAIVAFEAPAPAVTWEPFSEEALAAARAQGRPVVLDFSADWCVPCHELDDKTFSDASVARALQPFVRLKVDLTRFDSPASLALRKRFDIQGVPTIVFLAPDGREVVDARSVGFVPPASFRARAEQARAARAAA